MQQIKRITSNTKESIRIVTHLPARYIVLKNRLPHSTLAE